MFSSDDDPRFVAELDARVRRAKHSIFIAGMGLSFLKGNNEIVQSLDRAMAANTDLRVSIFFGNPNSGGILNRVAEEARASDLTRRPYRPQWPEQNIQSVLHSFRAHVRAEHHSRVFITHADSLPMMSIIRIDSVYFWYAYGTPDIRGKESPWIMLAKRGKGGELVRFIDQSIAYYEAHPGQNLLGAAR